MAPKSKSARFIFTGGMILAMALTILMIMADRDLAQPSCELSGGCPFGPNRER